MRPRRLALMMTLVALGCASGTNVPERSTGSLSVDLTVGDFMIDEVLWKISGGDMEDMMGTINTSAPGSTASVEVFGIPEGEGYLIEMEATSTDGELTCKGDANFDVTAGQATEVHVMLNCKKPSRLGGVRVDGKFNICAELTKVVVSPLQTSVGNDITLNSQAVDQEGDPITYAWTSNSGSIADPAAANTTYTCTEAGDDEITITVSDDGGEYCMSSWTVPVTCVPSGGGTGGVGGSVCAGEESPDEACADGNPCTVDSCDLVLDRCQTSVVTPGQPCSMPGTGAPGDCDSLGMCVAAGCVSDADCDTGNECSEGFCDVGTGICTPRFPLQTGTACNGGLGQCDGAGICIDNCDDVDCSDADPCTVDICIPSDDTPTCRNSPRLCNPGNECLTASECNPNTGACSSVLAINEGAPCRGDTGTCRSGRCIDNCVGVDCSDGSPCTEDLCDPADGLATCANVPAKEGEACDAGFGFSSGMCMNGTCVDACPNRCDDANECTLDACLTVDGAGVCFNVPDRNGFPCDAGPGPGSGTCFGSTCRPPDNCTRVDCSDDNPCTEDLCDDFTGSCSNPPSQEGAACDAGRGPGTGTCESGTCIDFCPGGCADDNPCTLDLCDTASGSGVCQFPSSNEGLACDAGEGPGSGSCRSGTCIPDCPGGCDDGNDCTSDLCDTASGSGTCVTAPAPNGSPCDAGAGPGSGTCAAGNCGGPPPLRVGVGSGVSVWNAQPKAATGCTYDPVTTTCSDCMVSDEGVPGGGQCAQFGTQVVRGCQIPGGVLNAQLAIDTFVKTTVSSLGDGSVTHDVDVVAINPALIPAAGIVTIDRASFVVEVSSGLPGELQNVLDPAVAGDLLGLYTSGTDTLTLTEEIPAVTTPVIPTSSPTVEIGFNGDFAMDLDIVGTGDTLFIRGCFFDLVDPPVALPVN